MSDITPSKRKKKVLSPAAAERQRARNREYMRRLRQERKLAGTPMYSEQAAQNRREACKRKYHSDPEFRKRRIEAATASSKRRYAADKTPWQIAGEKKKQKYWADAEYRDQQRKLNRDRSRRRYSESDEYRKRHAESFKKWAARNQDHRRKYRRNYKTKRLREDVHFWLAYAIRTRLNIAVRNGYKAGSAVKLLGCSIDEFKQHLQAQFVPGMTWENRGLGGWHIDHIVPLSAFDLFDPKQLAAACHHTNMQPLWETENLRKKNAIPGGVSASTAVAMAHSKARGAKCKTTARQSKKKRSTATS